MSQALQAQPRRYVEFTASMSFPPIEHRYWRITMIPKAFWLNGISITSLFGVAWLDLAKLLTSVQWLAASREPMEKTSDVNVSMPEAAVQNWSKNTKVVTTFWQ